MVEAKSKLHTQKARTLVEGRRIETIHEQYTEGNFHVNRRYQRKLVWSLAQKQALIDSILKSIPIPLILLARSERVEGSFEIIDGLQRINAVVSFMENRYAFEGEYFNLESLGLTKYMRDRGSLEQLQPIMSREKSLQIAQYTLPVSTYSATASSLVDETFRRINSSGRQLGMQEVRQAGSTSKISDVVRQIAADIRGDVSRADYLSLEEMSKLSLKWKEDSEGNGVPVEDIFWITERILRRDDLRSSKDEQLVLDLIVDILGGQKFDTSSEVRDAVYDESSEVGKAVSAALARMGDPEALVVRFSTVLALMAAISKKRGKTWTQHTGKSTNNPTARYFHIAFMAFYDLLFVKSMEVSNMTMLVDSTADYWAGQKLDLGGTWKGRSRRGQVKKFVGAIQDCFSAVDSPEISVAREDVERLKRDFLRFASENRFYELKQGITDLSGTTSPQLKNRRSFFDKIIKTCTAMSNTLPGANGVVYLGVSDSAETTKKVAEVYNVSPLDLGDSAAGLPNDVIGIDHELAALGKSLDVVLETFKNWILNCDKIPDSAKEYKKKLASSLRPIRIVSASGDCRTVIAIYADPVSAPIEFDGKFWERIGSGNHQFEAEERQIQDLFDRYEEFRYRSN